MQPENWAESKNILVILAHPDDPEFFCGATIARWTSQGHRVSYCLLTHGEKGARDPRTDPRQLAAQRVQEQTAAAAILGVQQVSFLDYIDGELVPSLEARRAVVRLLRTHRPDILLTCDPTNFLPHDGYINHPDHRAAGQIVLDALFPASGNPLYFPELLDEGLPPHMVQEVWLSLTAQPDTVLDVTPFFEQRLTALLEHRSQIGDPEPFKARLRTRFTPFGTAAAPQFVERFRRIKF
ncbi:MAG TPA: PIG-L family deacetylase [Anaerolineaceae bacterium]|jgi:LmbE family N-acetylglucosaminyl deacetylase|nr:PIG-L family deacetylase [Anaerolineaceae bacterium]